MGWIAPARHCDTSGREPHGDDGRHARSASYQPRRHPIVRVARGGTGATATCSIPMTILVAAPQDALFQRYNLPRATPFYYLLDHGYIQAHGMLGSAEWNQLVQAWQARAAAQRAEFRRYT